MSSSAFDKLINEIKINENNQRDKGTAFENLVVAYLKNEPAFKNQYSNVWLLKDVPEEYGISKVDTGVDIVARKNNGDLTAVQAKFYEKKVGKDTINSFIAETSKDYYVDGLIVSTTDDWNKNAERALNGNTKTIIRKGLSDLRHANVDWENFEKNNDNNLSVKSNKKLRGYQKEAIEKAVKYFKSNEENHDRGKLIMAPGTGKTFTSLKITEALMKNQMKNKFNVLYLVPSIQLLSQTLFNWNDDVSDDIHMTSFSVVSDRKATKKENNDDSILTAKDVGFPATTNVDELINNYEYVKKLDTEREMTVVFSTYQSIDVINQAQEMGYPEFDLIIADEAHRTTGATKLNEDSMFTEVHSNSNVKGKLRLYQTATPKIYDQNAKKKAQENSIVVSSMDDPEKYGYEFFRLGFGDAVAQGYLTDYKVSVLAVSESYINKDMQQIMAADNQLKVDDIGKIIGVWNAMVKRNGITGEVTGAPMKRAIAFSDTIKHSKAISKEFSSVVNEYLNTQSSESFMVDVHHVDGGLNALQKTEQIDWLGDEQIEENRARILSNVRFLTEGIDVPNLDAIIFFSPKKSQVDIVQAVGRIMRKSENKEYGYIILPIVVSEGVDPSSALDNDSKYKEVWQVLNALRSTDDRFDAEINKIDLNKKKPDNLQLIGVNSSPDESVTEQDGIKAEEENVTEQLELPLDWKEMRNAFYGKVVQKVGYRRYLEDWSKDVADIAKRHINRIGDIIDSNDGAKMAFDNFLNSLHYNINDSIGKEQAIEMLAQHLITEPIFEALFSEYSFVRNNAVSKAMNDVVGAFSLFGFDKEQTELKPFYDSIKLRATGIDNAAGKQKLIITLYDKFFRTGFKKTTEQLGIVFTPIEVVDFIINSVDYVLKKYLGKSLIEKKVHVLDPFTGTGTFMTRTLNYFKEQLENGLITYDELLYKYMNEMHANEIVLLSYYIAAINIETTFEEINENYGDEKSYHSFNGIVLTDTFASTEQKETLDDNLFGENDKRLEKEKEKDITAIISNPPYSAKQKRVNNQNANAHYPNLDNNISNSYAKYSNSNNKNNVYDSYIRALRWATDRIGNKGVIGFVSNGQFLNSISGEGIRYYFHKEFNHLYIFNLRGDARTSGEKRRKEKDNIFGQGSRTPIAISILVKDDSDEHEIFYHDIGDYLKKNEKLNIIEKFGSIENINFDKIVPNKRNEWINKTNFEYYEYSALTPQDDEKSFSSFTPIFNTRGIGYSSSRDAWVISFSKDRAKKNSISLANEFNNQVRNVRKEDDLNYNDKEMNWSDDLIKRWKKKDLIDTKESQMRIIQYRPFVKKWVNNLRPLIKRPSFWNKAFGEDFKKDNIILNFASKYRYSVLATNSITDYQFMFNNKSVPLNVYESYSLLDDSLNISDQWKNLFKKPEDAFYYVYAINHSPEYRIKYSNELTNVLPHIPLAKNREKYVEIGKKLVDLHVNYESVEPYNNVRINISDDKSFNYKVNKMKFGKINKDTDITKIIYNDYIYIEGIPEKAYKYHVNGKSPIDWVMDEYLVKTNKETGIVDDPNDFSDDPKYILNLLLSVITVSMKTLDLIDELPPFELDE